MATRPKSLGFATSHSRGPYVPPRHAAPHVAKAKLVRHSAKVKRAHGARLTSK